MKKILFLIVFTAFLTACGVQNNATQTGSTVTQTGTENNTQTNITDTDTNADAVTTASEDMKIKAYYILRDTNEDGEILEANMDENGNPKDGATALEMQLSGLIPGFRNAVRDMKAGETKSFTVTPEEGYGTDMIKTEVPYEQYAPKLEMIEDISILEGKITEERKISELSPEFIKEYINDKKDGDIIAEENGATVKLIQKTDEKIIIEILNTNSPFYNKKIAVGEKVTINDPQTEKDIHFTVTKIENGKATIEVEDTASPFYGKEFIAGATSEEVRNGKTIKMKIISINDTNPQKTITIEQTNLHPMANKTLHFTVKVESIEKIKPQIPSIQMIPESEMTDTPSVKSL